MVDDAPRAQGNALLMGVVSRSVKTTQPGIGRVIFSLGGPNKR